MTNNQPLHCLNLPHSSSHFSKQLHLLYYLLLIFILLPTHSPLVWPTTSPDSHQITSGTLIIGSSSGVSLASQTYTHTFENTILNIRTALCIHKLSLKGGSIFLKFKIRLTSLTSSGFVVTLDPYATTVVYQSSIQFLAYDTDSLLATDLLALSTIPYQITTNQLMSANQSNFTLSLPSPYSSSFSARTSLQNTIIKCFNYLLGFEFTLLTGGPFKMDTNCYPVQFDDTDIVINFQILSNSFNQHVFGNVICMMLKDYQFFGYFNDALFISDTILSTSNSIASQLQFMIDNGIDVDELTGVWLCGLKSIDGMKYNEVFTFDGDWFNSNKLIVIGGEGANNIDPLYANLNAAQFFYMSLIVCGDGQYYNRGTSQCEEACNSETKISEVDIDNNIVVSIRVWNGVPRDRVLFWEEQDLIYWEGVNESSGAGDIYILGKEQSVNGSVLEIDLQDSLSQSIVVLKQESYVLIGDTLHQIFTNFDNLTNQSTIQYQSVFTLDFANIGPINLIGAAILYQSSQTLLLMIADESYNLYLFQANNQSSGQPSSSYTHFLDDLLAVDQSTNLSALTQMIQSQTPKINCIYSEEGHSQVQIVLNKYILIYSQTNGTLDLSFVQILNEEDIINVETNEPELSNIQLIEEEESLIIVNCIKREYISDRMLYLYVFTSTSQLIIYRSLNPWSLSIFNASTSFSYHYQPIITQYLLSPNNTLFTSTLHFVTKSQQVTIDSSSDASTLAIGTDSNLIYILGQVIQPVNECIQQLIDEDVCVGNTTQLVGTLESLFPEQFGNPVVNEYRVLDIIDLEDILDGGQIFVDLSIGDEEYKVVILTQNYGVNRIRQINCYGNMLPFRTPCIHFTTIQYPIQPQQSPSTIDPIENQTTQNNQSQSINNSSQQFNNSTTSPSSPSSPQTTQNQDNINENPSDSTPSQVNPPQQTSQQQPLSTVVIIIISCTGGVVSVIGMVLVYQFFIKQPVSQVKVHPRDATRDTIVHKQNGGHDSLAEFTYSNDTTKTIHDSHPSTRLSEHKVENAYQPGLIREKSRRLMIIEDIE